MKVFVFQNVFGFAAEPDTKRRTNDLPQARNTEIHSRRICTAQSSFPFYYNMHHRIIHAAFGVDIDICVFLW